MRRVVVAHYRWGGPGGAEALSVAVLRAFLDLGCYAALASIERLDTRKYRDWFGYSIPDELKQYTLFERAPKLATIYQRLLYWVAVKKAVKGFKPEILWIDDEFYKPIVKLKHRLGFHIIEYVHFPFSIIWDSRFKHSKYYWKNNEMYRDYMRMPYRLYIGLWRKLYNSFVKRDNPFETADLVIANSRWTAKVIKQHYGEEPHYVLNPPIPPTLLKASKQRIPSFEERERIVVMLGRFSRGKRYHWVVERIAPKLAREGVSLVIMGGVWGKSGRSYYNFVKKLVENLGLVDKVKLIANPSQREVLEMFEKARVFLHATIEEHWGMAVAEAMARGLPPVVHRSGGTWTDLVNEGEAGLGYDDAEECVEAVMKLVEDGKVWRVYSQRAVARVRGLSYDEFVKKLLGIINRL